MSETLPPDLATAIADARRALGWSCRRAAREVGVCAPYLSRLERGIRCPSVAVADDLIEVLKLSPADAERLLAVARPDVGRSSPFYQQLVRWSSK